MVEFNPTRSEIQLTQVWSRPNLIRSNQTQSNSIQPNLIALFMQRNSDIFFITAAIIGLSESWSPLAHCYMSRDIQETTDGRRSPPIARPRLPHSTSAGLISTAGEMHRSQVGSSRLDRSPFPVRTSCEPKVRSFTPWNTPNLITYTVGGSVLICILLWKK